MPILIYIGISQKRPKCLDKNSGKSRLCNYVKKTGILFPRKIAGKINKPILDPTSHT